MNDQKDSNHFSWERRLSGDVVLHLSGHWLVEHGLVRDETLEAILTAVAPGASIVLEAGGLLGWDSSLIEFLTRCVKGCRERGIAVDRSGTPNDIAKLVSLALAVPDRTDRRRVRRPPPLARLGTSLLKRKILT